MTLLLSCSPLPPALAHAAQVCNHPYLLPEFDPGADAANDVAAPSSTPDVGGQGQRQSTAGAQDASVQASGKLLLLVRILECLQQQGKRALLLSHSSKVRVQEWVDMPPGSKVVVRQTASNFVSLCRHSNHLTRRPFTWLV